MAVFKKPVPPFDEEVRSEFQLEIPILMKNKILFPQDDIEDDLSAMTELTLSQKSVSNSSLMNFKNLKLIKDSATRC